MRNNIILLGLLAAFSSPVHAEQWYVDIGAGFVNFDDSVDELSPTNLYARGGYIFNEYINAGLEASITLSPDQIPSQPTVDFDVDIITFYLRGGVPINEDVRVYAQIGSSNTELTGSSGAVAISADDSDTMLGFGAEIDVGSQSTYIALNYSKYFDDNGVEASAFNVGVGARY